MSKEDGSKVGRANVGVTGWKPQYKTPKSKLSGKEGLSPFAQLGTSVAPRVGESGKEFAKRLMEAKYGPGNYKKGPGSEFNKIQRWGDRAFEG